MQVKDALGISNKTVEGRERASGPQKSSGRAAKVNSSGSQAGSADRVEISQRSREAAQAREVLASTPPVRGEKVAELKSQIENNTYEVKPDKVAHKMIVDFLNELV